MRVPSGREVARAAGGCGWFVKWRPDRDAFELRWSGLRPPRLLAELDAVEALLEQPIPLLVRAQLEIDRYLSPAAEAGASS